jgi:Ran GTPase-activating protein (RanGAP) involved in mRNA processing and transport
MSLNISWNAIGARGANALATAVSMNQTLTSLDVAGNNIGNEGMASFARALMKNRTLSSIE